MSQSRNEEYDVKSRHATALAHPLEEDGALPATESLPAQQSQASQEVGLPRTIFAYYFSSENFSFQVEVAGDVFLVIIHMHVMYP